jgi:transketolase
MMEGVAAEAPSLAGHLGLGKLTLVYDNTHITIEGPTEITFTEDVARRYEAYGWHVLHVEDANDTEAIAAAYRAAIDEPERPSFIRLRTHIAGGAARPGHLQGPRGGPGRGRGAGDQAGDGWDPDKHFKVPEDVPERCQARVPANQRAHAEWRRRLAAYADAEPAINAIAPNVPTLVGGSADLAESNLTGMDSGGRPDRHRGRS